MKKSDIKKSAELFEKLVEIMKILRSPQGCVWDRKQSHDSLIRYIREEVSEFITEVKRKNYPAMKEELGDILLQVVFHSQIASENGKFNIADVIESINEKLVRRHPHVFGDVRCNTPQEVEKLWKEIKRKEKRNKKEV